MSPSTELYRVRLKPSSTTTTALLLTYRPIIFLLFIGPTLVMSPALITTIFRRIFGPVTDQNMVWTIFMTVLFSKILKDTIANAAPTKEIANKSVERSRGFLFIATFSASVCMIRLVVIPLEKIMGFSFVSTWLTSISIFSALRLACGGFLLGLSVVARYIGPQSVAFRVARSSLNAPEELCQPDDPQPAKNLKPQNSNPRRLQLPSVASLSAQFVLSILFAYSLASISVLPFAYDAAISNISPSTKRTIVSSCIISSAVHLISAIHGTKNEINPTQYQSHSGIWDRGNFTKSLNLAFIISFAVPLLAINAYYQDSSFHWSDTIVYYGIVPFVIILYLCIFDYALRVLICTTPSNIKVFVEEASGGDVSTEIFVDVILRSLLHSNDVLAKRLGNLSTNSSMWMDLEEEELKLNNGAIGAMANTLLHKTKEDEASPHLEEDILRLAILSSIGSSVSKEEGTIGNYADSSIKYWVKSMSIKPEGGMDSIDPYAVPINRALCAYAGGLGEALRTVSDSESHMFHRRWVLPPGALFMAECAIRGATCWILQSTNTPRSNTSLEILIPVLLNSVCKLENGLSRYLRTTNQLVDPNATNKVESFQSMSPQFLPLFKLCSNISETIIQTVKADKGFSKLKFLESLDKDCETLLRSKMIAS